MHGFSRFWMWRPLRGVAFAGLSIVISSCGGQTESTPAPASRAIDSSRFAAASAQVRRDALGEPTVVINPVPASMNEGLGAAGARTAARDFSLVGTAVDAAGNLYLTLRDKSIRKITLSGEISILPENSADLAATSHLNNSTTIASDAAGNLQVTDTAHCTLRRITPAGRVTTTTLPRSANTHLCNSMQASR